MLQDGRCMALEELADMFKSAGVILEKPIVAPCGTIISGYTSRICKRLGSRDGKTILRSST